MQNGQQKPESNGNEKTLTPKMIVSLWERMSHIYGHKWTSTYGESAVIGSELTDTAKTWASALREITGQQIADGLRACLEREDTWPPTLPEFKQLCDGKVSKKVNEFGLDYVPQCYRTENRITDKSRLLNSDEREVKRDTYREKIGGLKDILR